MHLIGVQRRADAVSTVSLAGGGGGAGGPGQHPSSFIPRLSTGPVAMPRLGAGGSLGLLPQHRWPGPKDVEAPPNVHSSNRR